MAITEKELIDIIKAQNWEKLGQGVYNTVYRSQKSFEINGVNSQWVIKQPHRYCSLNRNDRAVRLWNKINPGFPAMQLNKNRWIAPYLGNTQASDEEIAMKVIDIYRNTRTIIADACSPRNFLVHEGVTVCVDFDMAFTRGSRVTEDYQFYDAEFQHYLNNAADKFGYVKTSEIIHALAYLERYIPASMIVPRYISRGLLSKLTVFRLQKASLTTLELDLLNYIERIDPQGTIKNKLLTPNVIEQFGWKKIDEATQDKLTLEEVIYDSLVRQGISAIIKTGDLDALEFLDKKNSTLLTTRDAAGYLPVHYVALYGNEELVRYFFYKGYDLNAPVETKPEDPHHGMTPLELAVIKNHGKTGRALIAFGAKGPSLYQQHIPRFFIFAARNGLLEQLRQLHAMNPSLIKVREPVFRRTALILAAMQGHESVVRFLLENGAELHEKTVIPASDLYKDSRKFDQFNALDWAIYMGHFQVAIRLQEAGISPNFNHQGVLDIPMIDLVKQGMLEKVKHLVHFNPAMVNELDMNGYTPLHYAAYYNQVTIAEYLMHIGASPEIVSKMPSGTMRCEISYYDFTPWLIALSRRYVDLVRLMEPSCAETLSLGLDAGIKIFFAASNGLFILLKRLIKDMPYLINSTDEGNRGLLYLAAQGGFDNIVQYLIEQKVDLNQTVKIIDQDYLITREDEGFSPLDIAIKGGHKTTIELLSAAGAKPNRLDIVKDAISPRAQLSFFSPASSSSQSLPAQTITMPGVEANEEHCPGHVVMQ